MSGPRAAVLKPAIGGSNQDVASDHMQAAACWRVRAKVLHGAARFCPGSAPNDPRATACSKSPVSFRSAVSRKAPGRINCFIFGFAVCATASGSNLCNRPPARRRHWGPPRRGNVMNHHERDSSAPIHSASLIQFVGGLVGHERYHRIHNC
jgi:hypothetical protein